MLTPARVDGLVSLNVCRTEHGSASLQLLTVSNFHLLLHFCFELLIPLSLAHFTVLSC